MTEHRNPSAEAARYRRRLRDAEAARDAAEAALDACRWLLVDHLVAEDGLAPTVLRRVGPDLDDLLDADGLVDAVAVAAAVAQVKDELGALLSGGPADTARAVFGL